MPPFSYSQYIKNPDEMKITSSSATVDSDIAALGEYVKLLISGYSTASKNGGAPLGNKYFIDTNTMCRASDSNSSQERYFYIDNYPIGVSQGTNAGLLPSLMQTTAKVKPISMDSIFTDQKCQLISMKVGENGNWSKSNESHYVTESDIAKIHLCSFQPSGVNPITKRTCALTPIGEGFEGIGESNKEIETVVLTTAGVLGIYLLFCIMNKMRK